LEVWGTVAVKDHSLSSIRKLWNAMPRAAWAMEGKRLAQSWPFFVVVR
jgi:hypothetical protein